MHRSRRATPPSNTSSIQRSGQPARTGTPTPDFATEIAPKGTKRPRFTLLHLLLLIFAGGFLSGLYFSYTHTELFFPKYLEEKPRSGLAGCCSNLIRIGLALEHFHRVHGHYPASQVRSGSGLSK